MAADAPEGEDWGFAAPPFDAPAALVTLRRQLRELRPLVERGERWELRGREVVRLAVAGGAIEARVARRPAVTPEWTTQRLANAAAVRRWLDELRGRVRRWDEDADA